MMSKKKIIAGALGSDVHVAGVLNFLDLANKEGYDTVYLGGAVPLEKFIGGIIETDPDIVAISYRLDSDAQRLPEIEFVEPNYLFFSQAEVTPNDPYYPEQWHYSLINLPAAWSITKGSSLTVVAVIDTGVRFDHPDLQGVFYDEGYDFIDDDPDPTDPGMSYDGKIISHGTHVAGTIAALTNNSQGVSGVCWGGSGIRILPIRVLDDSGIGTSFDVARGIVYAVEHGAKVLNMSLGSPSDSSIIRDAIKYAYDNDVVVVCAAGNDNGSLRYPAKYPETIAVGAVRLDKERAWYSNYGPELDVVAPGGDLDVDQMEMVIQTEF